MYCNFFNKTFSDQGGLAQAAAMATDGKAITFNTAWVSIVTKTINNLWFNNARITNYIERGEIVTAMQVAVGKNAGLLHHGRNKALFSWKIFIPAYGPIACHSIDTVIDALKSSNK